MRIALDATYTIDPFPSGVAVYCSEILNGLARAYPEDTFLHCYRPKQFRSAVKPAWANVSRRLLQSPLPLFRADIFHGLNQRSDTRPAKKVLTTFHDLFFLEDQYATVEFRQRFAEHSRRAAANSDLVIAVSQFTADQLHAHLGIDAARIRVIPHGVHQPDDREPTERKKIILSVGALQVRKNVVRLVEAFENTPADWSLVLAGAKTGHGAQQILDRIEQSPARSRIHLAGYVTSADLQKLFQRASIFAFPSLQEGFGIPVLEAMAHGLPVITSSTSALREVAGDAALLIDPTQTGQIRSAIERLIADEDLRRQLAARGKQRSKSFTWERAVHATYAVYQELM